MSGYNIRKASWECDRRALCAIRETVFVREQGVPVELEWDEFDAGCTHVLASDAAGNPIGTARFLPGGTIGRMAVLKEWRGKGVGGALLQWLLQEAGDRQIQQVTLNAQIYAAGFYAKFGFQIAGEKFLDAGILHVKMVLRL
ncbi:GNAT family N-acetyltransferase [Nitrosovibrio sp. Nv4]|uniref:GNAT family N-acetyltransferase n=1 Tax=Nitrosovibrio sp. Nv4 TaxID=1945880 RepID=UPI000BC5A8D4|nr:GNAT family N-acetyltransferase [Nitrosovibrio sp. Nv4]SOD40642.1 Predicted N-acyltransferase, GNAT family [Nitrosovibrio sp. Nv4]